jgi:predicted metal-dependent hydrolase
LKKEPKLIKDKANEMTHRFEHNHCDRLTTIMDGFMPDWRSRRDQLNDAPLAQEEWEKRRG